MEQWRTGGGTRNYRKIENQICMHPKQTKCKLRFTTDYVKLLNHFPFDANFHRHWCCRFGPHHYTPNCNASGKWIEWDKNRNTESREWKSNFSTIVLMECYLVYYSRCVTKNEHKQQQQQQQRQAIVETATAFGNNNKTVITHNHHTTLSVLFAYSILLLTCLEYLIFAQNIHMYRQSANG